MDPSILPLIFSETRVGAPFGIALSLGFAAAAGWFLLRPWPPRVLRLGVFGIVLALNGTALALLLQEREVRIDRNAREVVETEGPPGWGRVARWSFTQISAVAVEAERQSAFVLSLRAADRWIQLQRFDDPLQAEVHARALALLGEWPALRRGYRLETTARGGNAERFETAAGQQGISLDLGEVIRITEEPGAESAIVP